MMPFWSFPEVTNGFEKLFILSLFTILIFSFSALTSFLNASALIGKELVNLFLVIYYTAVKFFEGVHLAFLVIYEDSIVFIDDVIEKINFLGSLFCEFCILIQTVHNFFYWLISSFFQLVLETLYFFINTVKCTGQIIFTLQQCLQLLGFSLWTSLTSIPNLILHFLTTCKDESIKITKDSPEKAVQVLEYLYHLIYDIEFIEIFYLILGLCTVTLACLSLKHFYAILMYITFNIYDLFKIITLKVMSHKEIKIKSSSRRIHHKQVEDERLCIVCEDKPKEIIILPCKHLCTCSGCSTALIVQGLNCPLCRSHINSTLKVYW